MRPGYCLASLQTARPRDPQSSASPGGLSLFPRDTPVSRNDTRFSGTSLVAGGRFGYLYATFGSPQPGRPPPAVCPCPGGLTTGPVAFGPPSHCSSPGFSDTDTERAAMAELSIDLGLSRRAWLTLLLGLLISGNSLLLAEEPAVLPGEEQVVDVQIVGNRVVPQEKILRQIYTRAGRPFQAELIEEDVRRLNRTGMFVDVKPYSQRVAGGRAVVFEVVERPTVEAVAYVGNKKIKTTVLQKEVDLKAGDALDPYAVREARRKIEQFYHSRGFGRARVTIWEGDKPDDRRVVFLINEGQKQRVLWTQFVGNTIASDSRLRTQIRSKPGVLWFINGEVDYQEIEEDLKRLKAYYGSLGFGRARIGRELRLSEGGDWLTLTFVIDEGPRFQMRNISFIGNTKYSGEELASELTLKTGDYFDQRRMQTDVAAIQEKYGRVGYIFADINPEMRYLENQGKYDLVYQISEGDRYRVGRVNVEIEGENPHTKITTVLDRLSLGPGDIVDIRELRESERRLRRSGLFEIDPTKGTAPKIVFSPPELDLEEAQPQIARPPRPGSNVRGQSPDLVPCGPWQLTPAADSLPGERRVDLTLPCRRVNPQSAGGGQPEQQYGPAQGSTLAAVPRRPMVVRAQYTPEGGRAVPDLQPPAGSFTPQPPAPSAYPSSPGYSPAPTYPLIPATPAYPAAPIAPGPAYAAEPPSGSAPYGGGGVPPAQLPATEGVFGGDSLFFDGLRDEEPTREINIFPRLQETQTGRLMVGAGINSDLGLMGSFVLDEQNADLARFPRSWQDVWDGTAWRGAGQRFRIEAVPGTQVQRYMVNFQEPYLMNTSVSLALSGFFYDRRFFEWDEQRLGGRVALGYQFTHDLSGSLSLRGEKINVHNPVVPEGIVEELDEVVGDNALYGFGLQLAHDTRDSTFLATEGHLIELSLEYALGSFQYPRAEVDLRKYFLIHERPDGSGRHVLSLSTRFGWSGSDTPIYDHYYAGGFSTLRGFDFRSVAPRSHGVLVGGEMRLLASMEYLFPITADDMLRGVVFCDTGTVERTLDHWSDTYRVAPGFGLRIMIPAMGPAPIALDFGFPVSTEPGDDEQVFSFFVGFNR
jgi:outer membrane protein insertion porin family